ncbi:MAG: uracil-DNA glycosylase [Proteobacteria bacterium]|nr:uracil-DNA glycosylase [Pseudomonadota bacterium]MBU4504376.1 uracil-DNA glycosylase [Pseudomonadota bacterium]MCG2759055.1 uracil-DNA glycosylase [Desulfobacteraceae bacterium]
MHKLQSFVSRMRLELGLEKQIPDFDNRYGNSNAKILFLLEAPGKMAVKSGLITLENNDQTARNFKGQIEKSGVRTSDLLLWNIVPWYLGNGVRIDPAGVSDVKIAFKYLDELLNILTSLKFIVLVGAAARLAHVHLSYTTEVPVLSCHHPSPKVVNKYPEKVDENIRILTRLAKS